MALKIAGTQEIISEDNPLVEKFQYFLETKYKKEIERLADAYPKKRSLIIDFAELERFDYSLADELLDKPDMLIEAARLALKRIELPFDVKDFMPHVRFCNLPEDRKVLLRDLSSEHINKLICVEGVVKQITDVLPKLKLAVWRCNRCGNIYRIPQSGQNVVQPALCECRYKDFSLVEEQSKFVDYQKIQIQEPLEVLKGSEQPTTLDIYVSDDLVNKALPGEKVELVGILRLSPAKGTKLVFGRYLECVYLEQTQQEFEEIDITPEEEKKIKELAKDPEIYKKLINSIAPNIYGHEDVKEAIVLQLFGGVKKVLPTQTIRGNIHILLVGDPGVAKCVSADTEVLLSDGSFVPISKLVESNLSNPVKLDDGYYANTSIKIPLMNYDGKLVEGEVKRVYKRRAKELVLIRTRTGKELCVTHTHPLFVYDNGKVRAVPAEKITPGFFIAAPRQIKISPCLAELTLSEKGKTNAFHIKFPTKINTGLARFVGYMLAEGYARINKKEKQIRFTNSDKEILDDFTKIVFETFGFKPSLRSRKRSKEVICDYRELANFLQENFPELLHSSRCRAVPKTILKAPDAIVKEFLRAFIEAEGSISKTKRMLSVVSASKDIIKSLQLLLLRFGIISKVEKTRSRATNGRMKRPKTYYRLLIGGKFVQRYIELIGFITERKKKIACSLASKKLNTNTDIVPLDPKLLLQLRKKLGLSQSDFLIPRSTYQHYERGDRKPSRENLQIIANVMLSRYSALGVFDRELEERLLDLFKLAYADIFWDEVVYVKKFSKECWVYDIETNLAHNFISNLIYSHNSQLLMSANAIAPKSIYVGGKTSTGVGLTASAVKDEFGEGGWTLKAGALVLASGGIAMIDELDKMPSDERSALHEAMEQGTVSVAKAGIITRFKTDTSILAAANPKFSRFDEYEPLLEQIDLPPTLISRFDLFFMIKDVLDKTRDKEIAEFILKTHRAGERLSSAEVAGKKLKKKEEEEIKSITQPEIEPELLRKYISYARKNVFPVLSKEAMDTIAEFYVNLREKGKQEGSYAATHRQLEGLVRLAEASARVRLSNVVEKQDAERAIRLLKRSLKDVVTDPETGKIDIDLIIAGQTHTQIENMRKVLAIIKEKSKEKEMVAVDEVVSEAMQFGLDKDKVEDLLNKLEKKGEIYRPRYGFVKPTQKD